MHRQKQPRHCHVNTGWLSYCSSIRPTITQSEFQAKMGKKCPSTRHMTRSATTWRYRTQYPCTSLATYIVWPVIVEESACSPVHLLAPEALGNPEIRTRLSFIYMIHLTFGSCARSELGSTVSPLLCATRHVSSTRTLFARSR